MLIRLGSPEQSRLLVRYRILGKPEVQEFTDVQKHSRLTSPLEVWLLKWDYCPLVGSQRHIYWYEFDSDWLIPRYQGLPLIGWLTKPCLLRLAVIDWLNTFITSYECYSLSRLHNNPCFPKFVETFLIFTGYKNIFFFSYIFYFIFLVYVVHWMVHLKKICLAFDPYLDQGSLQM